MRAYTTVAGPLALVLAAAALAAASTAGARVADPPASPTITAPMMDNEPAIRPPMMDNEPATVVMPDKPPAASHPAPAGPPTWPSHPQAVTPAHLSAPATNNGDGVDWGEAGIIAGGALGLVGLSVGGVVLDRRRRHARALLAR